MRDELDRLLIAYLLRLYPANDPLPPDAAQRVVLEFEPHEMRDRITSKLQTLRRRGVLNPRSLDAYGLRPWLYLASGRTGQFDQIIRANTVSHQGVSHYVLYGDWDSLIMLYGSEKEAETFYQHLAEGTYESPPTRLTVDRVLLWHRLEPRELLEDRRPSAEDVKVLNELVADFDSLVTSEQRSQLLGSGHLLGADWDGDSAGAGDLSAFIGLTLHGRTSLTAEELLRALLNTDVISGCLVDAFQVAPSPPFPYLLRLSCESASQLDAATDALSLLRIRDISVKCTTLVVASCNEVYPLLREPEVSDFPTGPATQALLRVTESIFHALPLPEQRHFNMLTGEDQLRFTGQYAELRHAVADIVADPLTASKLESAISGFSSAVLGNPTQPNLTGAVTEMAVHVEELARRALSVLVSDVLGRDVGAAQRELRLPTRKISSLSLGKVSVALRAATGNENFVRHQELLDETWLDRLDAFGLQRNLWVHGGLSATGSRLSEEATSILIEATCLARWLTNLESSLKQSRNEPRQTQQAPDFFISHAWEDKESVARPLYEELKGRGYYVWLDEAELLVGDSLRTKIDDAIARARFGVIVLSESFFRKNWPQQELNGLFARQMHGTKVLLPVWHQIDALTVARYSPMLADKLAANTANGVRAVAEQIVAAYRAGTSGRAGTG